MRIWISTVLAHDSRTLSKSTWTMTHRFLSTLLGQIGHLVRLTLGSDGRVSMLSARLVLILRETTDVCSTDHHILTWSTWLILKAEGVHVLI